MNASEEPHPSPASGPRVPAAARWGLAVALGMLLAGSFFWLRSRVSDPTPLLTSERFNAAWQRWRERGPSNYQIQIRVVGRQPALYRVVVTEGEAVEAFRNEQPLQQRRTFETWSVPGMFSTMEADLTRVTQPVPGSPPARLQLRAEFDPTFGYPRKYRRIEWGQATEVAWEVERFESK